LLGLRGERWYGVRTWFPGELFRGFVTWTAAGGWTTTRPATTREVRMPLPEQKGKK
jgi:hypothetical protein